MAGERFYLDEDVDVAIAERLNASGLDAVTTRDMRMLESDDDVQLAFAARNQRIMFTHNRVDFEALAAEWFHNGLEHCGILWSPRGYPSYVTQWIVTGLRFYPDLANLIFRVPPPS